MTTHIVRFDSPPSGHSDREIRVNRRQGDVGFTIENDRQHNHEMSSRTNQHFIYIMQSQPEII